MAQCIISTLWCNHCMAQMNGERIVCALGQFCVGGKVQQYKRGTRRLHYELAVKGSEKRSFVHIWSMHL